MLTINGENQRQEVQGITKPQSSSLCLEAGLAVSEFPAGRGRQTLPSCLKGLLLQSCEPINTFHNNTVPSANLYAF